MSALEKEVPFPKCVPSFSCSKAVQWATLEALLGQFWSPGLRFDTLGLECFHRGSLFTIKEITVPFILHYSIKITHLIINLIKYLIGFLFSGFL